MSALADADDDVVFGTLTSSQQHLVAQLVDFFHLGFRLGLLHLLPVRGRLDLHFMTMMF